MVKKKMVQKQESSEAKIDSKKKFDFSKLNYWMIASVVLAVVLLIVVAFDSFSSISSKTASNKAIELAEMSGFSLEVLGTKDMGNFYEINYSIEGQEGVLHVTKDGRYVGQLSEFPEKEPAITGDVVADVPQELVKSDQPKVELFIMTHCPYGTQAEKGFIPFMESMQDEVDAQIRFVHYFMHEPEETETPRQICIREEQSPKFLPYLKCFLEGNGVVDPSYGLVMEGNDPDTCMERVGVDINKVNTCVDSGKWEEYYADDSKLSQSYGVQGSPTLVINGVQVSSGRSASAYLVASCSAFNNAPSKCSTLTLSTETPNPYFGWEGTGASASGSC